MSKRTKKRILFAVGALGLTIAAVVLGLWIWGSRKHVCIWTVDTVTKPATCTAEGLRTYICGQCHEVKTETLPKREHQYMVCAETASCAETGKAFQVCMVCGDRREGEAGAYGHDYQKVYIKDEPSCYQYAYYHMICSRCGASGGEGTEPPLDHTVVEKVIVQGDCVNATVVEYSCSVCQAPCGREAFLERSEHDWVTKRTDPYWDEEAKAFVSDSVTRCSRCNAEPGEREDL